MRKREEEDREGWEERKGGGEGERWRPYLGVIHIGVSHQQGEDEYEGTLETET